MLHSVLPSPKQVWPISLTLGTFIVMGVGWRGDTVSFHVVKAISLVLNLEGTNLSCHM